jgi:hypothetical protein
MKRIVGACSGGQDFRDKLSGNERIAELDERAQVSVLLCTVTFTRIVLTV